MFLYIKIYILVSILILLINIIVISYNSEIGMIILSIYCLVWIFLSLFILTITYKINEEQNNTTTIVDVDVEYLPRYSRQSSLPSYKSRSV